MKTLRLIFMLALCSGCATRKAAEPPSVPKGTPPLSALETPEVRTAEIVKAYPVGRYTDPHFPEAMHERQTLYRREQAAEWNYRPSNSYALPLGRVIAESNPSPSYYGKTNAEQMNAQQKAYAEALLEQNRALNQRIQDLQKQDSMIQSLQEEIERLQKELEAQPHTDAPASEKASPWLTPEMSQGFSSLDGGPLPEEDSISDPGDLILFARCEEDYGAFLISQMRLNSELSQQLDAIVRGGWRSCPQALVFRSVSHSTHPHHEPDQTQPAGSRRLAHHQGGRRHSHLRHGFLPAQLRQEGQRGDDPHHRQSLSRIGSHALPRLEKGTAFVVEGQLSYFKHPDTNRESYSIWADNFTDITAPKSKPQPDNE